MCDGTKAAYKRKHGRSNRKADRRTAKQETKNETLRIKNKQEG